MWSGTADCRERLSLDWDKLSLEVLRVELEFALGRWSPEEAAWPGEDPRDDVPF